MFESVSRDTVAKVVFILSLAVLAWVGGFATHAMQWFPSKQLSAVWKQIYEVKEAAIGGHPATEPRVYDQQGARIVDSTAVQPGMTLIPSIWKSFNWRPGVKLININGEVHHQWRLNPAEYFPEEFSRPLKGLMQFNEPDNTYLFPNGDLMLIIGRTGTVRLDACGEVQWRVKAAHHHSLTRTEDGSFWLGGRKEPPRQPDPLTGHKNVRHDLLVHLSEDGEVLGKIDIFDIIAKNKALTRRHMRFPYSHDVHLNDVEALPDSMAHEYPLFEVGDLVVSLANLSVVLVADPETLRVKWWTGKPFVMMHDPDFVGDGWIGVFDNNRDWTERGAQFGGNRVVAFQPHTDSVEVWFAASETNPVYTATRGNWQLLDNGNLFITESNSGRLVEVNPEGELVWEYIQKTYDKKTVARISRAERYNLTPQEVAQWPCSPDQDNN